MLHVCNKYKVFRIGAARLPPPIDNTPVTMTKTKKDMYIKCNNYMLRITSESMQVRALVRQTTTPDVKDTIFI